MVKRNQTQQASEDKEYTVLSVSRSLLRSEFGDKVADKLSDEDLKDFAVTLHDFYLSSTEEWKWMLSESYDVDFDD